MTRHEAPIEHDPNENPDGTYNNSLAIARYLHLIPEDVMSEDTVLVSPDPEPGLPHAS